jgi:hypothetical protein
MLLRRSRMTVLDNIVYLLSEYSMFSQRAWAGVRNQDSHGAGTVDEKGVALATSLYCYFTVSVKRKARTGTKSTTSQHTEQPLMGWGLLEVSLGRPDTGSPGHPFHFSCVLLDYGQIKQRRKW